MFTYECTMYHLQAQQLWRCKCWSLAIVFETNLGSLVGANQLGNKSCCTHNRLWAVGFCSWNPTRDTKSRKYANEVRKGGGNGVRHDAKLKWLKIQHFRKIAKFNCRKICEPQNRELNVSRKFHVIRFYHNDVHYHKQAITLSFQLLFGNMNIHSSPAWMQESSRN